MAAVLVAQGSAGGARHSVSAVGERRLVVRAHCWCTAEYPGALEYRHCPQRTAHCAANSSRRCPRLRACVRRDDDNLAAVHPTRRNRSPLCMQQSTGVRGHSGGALGCWLAVKALAPFVGWAHCCHICTGTGLGPATGAELGIGLVNGLWAFKTMLPSAVALAPALLRGALKVKVLVPQSSIPGRGSTRAFARLVA